jgi:hypothetical protein
MQEHEGKSNLIDNNDSNTNWNEVSLAQLLGFDDGSILQNQVESTEQATPDIENQAEVSTQNPIATHELFDDPQLGKTQPNFYSNPFAKFGAVGLVMLVVFGAGATVLNSIMSGKPKIAPTIANRETSLPKVEIADNPQGVETGKLKAQLALGSQAEKIKSVERSKSPKTSMRQRKIKPSNELNKRIAPRIASREIPDVRVSYVSRPMPQSIRYNSPRFFSVPRFQPVASISTSTLPKQQQATDPMEQWSKISRLGSYGGVEIADVTKSKTEEQSNDRSFNTVAKSEIPAQTTTIPRAILVSAVSNSTVETANYSELEPLHAEEAAIIGHEETQQLLRVGASGSGKLVTPLIWARHSSNNTDQKSTTQNKREKFIVQLTESLTTEGGFITLPKGSQLIAQVTDIQKSGLVQLEATQVLIDGKEYIFPSGAIAIRGNSGQPLMASPWGNKGGEIAQRDAETFAVGSLAKVGKVLNQPKEEQISTSSGFGATTSFSSTRRGSSNILGAVLEGGFEPLTQQILQRNQQALQEIQQREEVWYVKAGTDVQVFVNQTFQF